MTKKLFLVQFSLVLIFIQFNSSLRAQTYKFPDESEIHEGTWLQWPHQYTYGITFRNENDATWVAMTAALQVNEKVHIIAYNVTEKTRIINLLTIANVPLTNIDFKLFQTNDVWVRDNGPIYVRDINNNLAIQDWGFNGWGGDYAYSKCNIIPSSVANANGTTVINLNSVMTVEGGAYELDGNGVFLGTQSSILSQSNPSSQIKSIRNIGMTQSQANTIFTQYLGATKFYWLDGGYSADDITEYHIDGFAKFAPGNKLVTMNNADLLYWGVSANDINTLYNMTNVNNIAYSKIYLPLTVNNVSKTNGTNLGYKGSYANYYLANNRVLVPNYNDPNDAVANSIIAGIYPGRTVIGIDCRNLYGNGGMIHCVTQQQPMAGSVIVDTQAPSIPSNLVATNITSSSTTLSWIASVDNVGVLSYDVYQGSVLKATVNNNSCTITGLLPSTNYSFTVKAKDIEGNISNASNALSLTTLATTSIPIYCVSKGLDASGETINKVQISTINNTSTGGNGYSNFTAISTNLTLGNSYNISIKPNWVYGVYAEGYAVFIDYNSDGDFTDIGETVWTKLPSTATLVSGSFVIPINALIGNTRMRVSMKYNGIPSSCETFAYGQVEDYTVNLVAGVAQKMIPNSITEEPNEIKLYPNPVVGNELFIESKTILDGNKFRLLSMSGMSILRGYLNENKIDVSHLTQGLYILEIELENRKIIKYLIKQ